MQAYHPFAARRGLAGNSRVAGGRAWVSTTIEGLRKELELALLHSLPYRIFFLKPMAKFVVYITIFPNGIFL